MIIIIWIITIIITVAGCIICVNAARINSIISGSRLLEMDSAAGAKYVQSYSAWKYAAYISLIIIITAWIICIIYSIYKNKKKHVQTETLQDPVNTYDSIKNKITEIPETFQEQLHNAGIVIIQGQMQGAELNMVSGEKITVGRDPSVSNLILPGKKVSRKHCSIQYSQEKKLYRIRCYSGNGLYYSEGINGKGRKKLEKDNVIWMPYGTLVFMPGNTDVIKLK